MKLTLDISTWRCGDNGPNKLGEGKTKLLNEEGFSCCLGQIALQLGATKEQILNNENFAEANIKIDGFTELYENIANKAIVYNIDNHLSMRLMEINDSEYTTVEEKISYIKDKLEKCNIELEVINET